MPALTDLAAWKALSTHRDQIAQQQMRDLFASDPDRFATFSLKLEDMLFDYSKNRITRESLRLLVQLARE
ncbi:MAG: glucose-6-phosphate isomerase, partial [Magnetococcales bacterium]|nr:glucose-6-phosphate isomerase [Magnetococcales bacterium]